jgi:hypothetical protein
MTKKLVGFSSDFNQTLICTIVSSYITGCSIEDGQRWCGGGTTTVFAGVGIGVSSKGLKLGCYTCKLNKMDVVLFYRGSS